MRFSPPGKTFGRIVSRGGCSATQGARATTSKNAAPVKRTAFRTSDKGSAAMSNYTHPRLPHVEVGERDGKSRRSVKHCGRAVIRLGGAGDYVRTHRATRRWAQE